MCDSIIIYGDNICINNIKTCLGVITKLRGSGAREKSGKGPEGTLIVSVLLFLNI